jgi:hypothetical protein
MGMGGILTLSQQKVKKEGERLLKQKQAELEAKKQRDLKEKRDR